MSINKYHILSLLALLFTVGCRGSVDSGGSSPLPSGTTNLTLRVLVQDNSGLRSVSENDADPLANSGEGKVGELCLWLEKSGWMRAIPDKNRAPEYRAVFEVRNVTAESEQRSYTLLINGQKFILPTIPLYATTTVGLDRLGDLTDSEGFVMTADMGLQGTIYSGVEQPDRPGRNVFPEGNAPLPVERLVSKAQLHKDVTTYTERNLPGTLSNLHWSMAGSGKQVYFFRNQAGSRTLGANGLYDGLSTATDKEDLMKLSDWVKSESDTGNFAWRVLSDQSSDRKSVSDAIYFYEHALKETKGRAEPYPRTVQMKHVAYAKVYADLSHLTGGRMGVYNEKAGWSFSPMSRVVGTEEEARMLLTCTVEHNGKPSSSGTTITALADFQNLNKLLEPATSADFESDRWYWICATCQKEWYEKNKDKLPRRRFAKPEKKLSDSHSGHIFFLMHDLPGTFYVGEDGSLYNTLLAAIGGGNKNARKYARGRMVYLTPLNAQGEKDKVYNCDTRRNNIYDLAIQGINGYGLNYDPNDPDDPYIPAPNDNPLEPKPQDLPINNGPDATIKIKTRVLKWNYFPHAYDLFVIPKD